eukprot:CAMPEP_0174241616 /NCGR_PEP_ID=MMETSP0417-20130205/24008_1 /TAXON_ID=242541 /ORGANISM="Mayorella sp, Strain BSH-02190019" /LENGTH=447 /DNA_ID=CAMNT_0015320879 /DNA_START=8 /DNA_END=1351 /DNA_ORIENTATION=-
MTSRKGAPNQERVLQSLLHHPDNQRCADCPSRGPRWASVNLGIFICISCSGIHRSMGTHISKVRSTNLDKWLPEHLELCQRIGNRRAALIWEARLPAQYQRPTTGDMYALENFIRDKYERKKWFDPAVARRILSGEGGEDAHTAAEASAPSATAATSPGSATSSHRSRSRNGYRGSSSRSTRRPAVTPTPTTETTSFAATERYDAPMPSSLHAPVSRPSGGGGSFWDDPAPASKPTFEVRSAPKPVVTSAPAPSAAGRDGSFWDSVLAPAPIALTSTMGSPSTGSTLTQTTVPTSSTAATPLFAADVPVVAPVSSGGSAPSLLDSSNNADQKFEKDKESILSLFHQPIAAQPAGYPMYTVAAPAAPGTYYGAAPNYGGAVGVGGYQLGGQPMMMMQPGMMPVQQPGMMVQPSGGVPQQRPGMPQQPGFGSLSGTMGAPAASPNTFKF